MVAPGQYAETINHYRLLRTLEDMFGLPHTGGTVTQTPIVDVWTTCTTLCPADFNCDGVVNPDDLSDYIGAYFNQPPGAGADFNADGVENPDDLSDYINAFFEAPCG